MYVSQAYFNDLYLLFYSIISYFGNTTIKRTLHLFDKSDFYVCTYDIIDDAGNRWAVIFKWSSEPV